MTFPILYTSKIEKDVSKILINLEELNNTVVTVDADSDHMKLAKHRIKTSYLELQLSAHRMVQAERRLHVSILLGVLATIAALGATIIGMEHFIKLIH